MDASYCNNNTTASTLFVGDLSIFVTEKDLIHAFSCYGDIDEIKIMRCNETKKNLSYGFVKFISADAAFKAQEELNGSILQGRPMRIGWGMRKPFLQQQSSSTAVRSSIHINYQTNQVIHIVLWNWNRTYSLTLYFISFTDRPCTDWDLLRRNIQSIWNGCWSVCQEVRDQWGA